MSQIHSYLRILTGYGKPKSIGLSFLKSHPPVICWRFSNTTLRRYEKGATHEPYRKSPQIYIYIYILTSKAGLEYDLQSREIWRQRKREDKRSHACRRLQLDKICLLEREHGSCNGKRILPRNHCGGSSKPYCSAWLSRLAKYSWGKASSETFGFGGLRLSSRRLTSKEVAA